MDLFNSDFNESKITRGMTADRRPPITTRGNGAVTNFKLNQAISSPIAAAAMIDSEI
jgi:hypothetical protein